MSPERRSETLDERTDRLARRRYPFPPERDTYIWANLRLNVAAHDATRAVRDGLTPAIVRFGATMKQFGETIERLRDRLP